MKKAMTLILLTLLTVSLLLTGCGSEDISGKVDPSEETAPLSLGRMEGGTYTNSYAGFGCKLDSSWTFYSAAELQEIPGNVADMYEGTELEDALKNTQQITDMMAENTDQMCTMNVLLQKVNTTERLAAIALGEAGMIDNLITEQGELLRSSYTQIGIDIISMERKTVTFLGEEHSALYTVGSTQGTPVYFLQIMDYSRGGYAITITFSSYEEDQTGDMLALFFALD